MKTDQVSAIVLTEEEKLALLCEIRSIFLKAQDSNKIRVGSIYPKLDELKGILDIFHTAV